MLFLLSELEFCLRSGEMTVAALDKGRRGRIKVIITRILGNLFQPSPHIDQE